MYLQSFHGICLGLLLLFRLVPATSTKIPFIFGAAQRILPDSFHIKMCVNLLARLRLALALRAFRSHGKPFGAQPKTNPPENVEHYAYARDSVELLERFCCNEIGLARRCVYGVAVCCGGVKVYVAARMVCIRQLFGIRAIANKYHTSTLNLL